MRALYFLLPVAVLIAASSAYAQKRVPEPAISAPPLRFTGPLPVTPDTVLNVTFDEKGVPVAEPGTLKAKSEGPVTPLSAARDLPGFSGIVRVENDQAKSKGRTAAVVVEDAAALLGKGAFTIDAILRFSLGDGSFFEAGPGAEFQWGLLDRDAGGLFVRLPGEGKTPAIASSGVLEKVGPVARDRFQRLTLTYDGAGTFTFFIDGTECFQGKAPGLAGALPLSGGPIAFGDVTPSKSRFQGDLAQMRIREGAHAPETPAHGAPTGGTAAWAFDMKWEDAPSAPGHQAVILNDIFADGRGFGWTAKPEGGADLWFVGERYSAEPEKVIAQKTRRPRARELRDALLIPSGEGFVAKVPAGNYAVSVSLGRPDQQQMVDRVEANGSVIGRNLITLPDAYQDSDDRTARGIVEVGKDGLLKVRAFSKEKNGKAPPVGFLSVSILPVAPLPVEREGENLIWKGAGPAPEAFIKARQEYAAGNREAAFETAGAIPDRLARAATRAWIVGYPDLTSGDTLARLTVIQEDLLVYLREHPNDVAARYLEDLTLRLWHAATAYVNQASTSRIYGAAKGRAWREGVNLALQVQPGEPYYGQARLLAGNMIWQFGQQAGGYLDDANWRVPHKHLAYAPPPAIFREVLNTYPDAELPKVFLSNNMVLSESEGGAKSKDDGRVPARAIPIPDGAPAWAALQHRAITRLLDIVSYWHSERMLPDGTMGGGYGDDVEMMRWWKTAILVGGDDKALDGWNRLAATGWKNMRGQPMPEEAQDTEHVTENFSDSHGLLPLLHTGGPDFSKYMDRSRMLLPILKNVLMERDSGGYLVFKAFRFSRLKSGENEADVPYNLRAVLPLANYAFLRPDDKEVSDLIVDYARSWKDITLKEIDGKPAGIVPLMILWGRGGVKLPKGSAPDRPTDWAFPGYWTYEYPAGYSNRVYDLCLAAYYLTKDKSFLEPQRVALELLSTLGEGGLELAASAGSMTTNMGASGTGDYDATKFPRGSLKWAVRMNRAGLGLAGSQYRVATGDTSYDEVLLKHGPAYTKFLILSERAKTSLELAKAAATLEPVFESILDTLDFNEVLRTQLPQSTDRVWVPGMDFLESTATGDLCGAPPVALRGEEEFWPMFGATWRKTGSDVSVLVKTNSSNRFEAYLYNFLESAKSIDARLWQLAPGRYRARLLPSPDFEDQPPGATQEFEVKQKGGIVSLEVPPRRQQHLIIEPLVSP